MKKSKPSPTALVFVADGSEDIEFVTATDVLTRAGFDVDICAPVSSSKTVTLSRGLVVSPTRLEIPAADAYDVAYFPGGMPGAETLSKSADVVAWLKSTKTPVIGAVCAAPAVVLARNGLLDECEGSATCHPSFFGELPANMATENDLALCRAKSGRKYVTSRGPGTTLALCLAIAGVSSNSESVVRSLGKPMCVDEASLSVVEKFVAASL